MNLNIKTSENINEIISALAKAQGEMKPAVFNKINPHYRNRYADFTSCMDACRSPLSKNGLAVSQMPSTNADGKFVLITLIAHTSGQWMAGEFPLTCKNTDNIQALGSVMSYAKRYSLCGMVGIVSDEDDDDGQSSVSPVTVAKIYPEQVNELRELEERLDEGYKNRFRTSLKKNLSISRFEDLPADSFQRVVVSLKNAIKLMDQEVKEVAHA